MTKLGALWIKTGKKGKFMSGVIKIDDVETKIVVFKNDRKESDKHPDYNIMLSEERKQVADDDDDNPFS